MSANTERAGLSAPPTTPSSPRSMKPDFRPGVIEVSSSVSMTPAPRGTRRRSGSSSRRGSRRSRRRRSPARARGAAPPQPSCAGRLGLGGRWGPDDAWARPLTFGASASAAAPLWRGLRPGRRHFGIVSRGGGPPCRPGPRRRGLEGDAAGRFRHDGTHLGRGRRRHSGHRDPLLCAGCRNEARAPPPPRHRRLELLHGRDVVSAHLFAQRRSRELVVREADVFGKTASSRTLQHPGELGPSASCIRLVTRSPTTCPDPAGRLR